MHLYRLIASITSVAIVVDALAIHNLQPRGYPGVTREPRNENSEHGGLLARLLNRRGCKKAVTGTTFDKIDLSVSAIASRVVATPISAPTLDPSLIQTGSQDTGNHPGEVGQATSQTDSANFINFCKGKILTNGQQFENGSCNGIPMGNIPAVDKMISSIILSPPNAAVLPSHQNFTVRVHTTNLAAGHFTNATSTYYSAPQDLDSNGQVIGHVHVVIQTTGVSLNPTEALDPKTFAFFEGIDDAGDGKGTLSAVVAGGLPAGNYRLCTLSSAANHQPAMMPVAKRGAQDDCVRFSVSDDVGHCEDDKKEMMGGASSSDAMGGIGAPPITKTGDKAHPYKVGDMLCKDKPMAVEKACEIQHTGCVTASKEKTSDFTSGDCDKQVLVCRDQLILTPM